MNPEIEAIYEDGVLKPLQALNLPDHQRVTLTLRLPPIENPDSELAAWREVYANLTDKDVDEIEAMALNRGC